MFKVRKWAGEIPISRLVQVKDSDMFPIAELMANNQTVVHGINRTCMLRSPRDKYKLLQDDEEDESVVPLVNLNRASFLPYPFELASTSVHRVRR